MECVVIESDWPEYEPVWSMLEKRAQKQQMDDEEDLIVSAICQNFRK